MPTLSSRILDIVVWTFAAMPIFISNLKKSNNNKFSYLADRVLQSWAAL